MSDDIMTLPSPAAEVRIAYGADRWQFADLRLPAGRGPHPVVLALHGGYWRARYDLAYLGHLCAALTAAGLATWNVEYRRLGNAGGGWPGTFLDVAAAAEHLRALAAMYPLDLSHVYALGHSAGGQLACWLAARHRIAPDSPLTAEDPLPIAGVVSLAGVLDLRRACQLHLSESAAVLLLGGTPDEQAARYDAGSPRALLPLGVRQILIHGTVDEDVPYAMSVEYAEAARTAGDPVELLTLPGVDHYAIIDPRTPAGKTTLAAVQRLAG